MNGNIWSRPDPSRSNRSQPRAGLGALRGIAGIVGLAAGMMAASLGARAEGLGVPVTSQIVIDQFGYPPAAPKVAVIRDPRIGFDASEHVKPGRRYALVDATTGAQLIEARPLAWHGGATDPSSGDKASWFDFSAVTRPGRYYILDLDRGVRSPDFRIGDDVYREVLKQAMRTFFYQRAGFAKTADYAGAGWADGASHLGPGQDRNARLYSAPNDPTTERDLSGGWYDAGDFNRYTSWSARYVVALLKAYQEKPAAFTDDYGIPESGNGTPDIIDEAKWGMDWLVRMQNPDGSALSVLGVAQASPPSAATGPSYYGNPSTSATLGVAGAFAFGAHIFRKLGQIAYADELLGRAERAYRWADDNPEVLFKNNDPASGTKDLAFGQQEVDDYARLSKKIEAAVYLFEATGKASYRDVVDANVGRLHVISNGYASPFEADELDMLLYYTAIPGSSPGTADRIRRAFADAMNAPEQLGAVKAATDPYRAYIKDYTWGSNSIKAAQGNLFYQLVTYDVATGADAERATNAALGYLNYLHGVNPLGLVYLTNMAAAGATNSVKEMFHAWFADGSPRWDRVGVSVDGPPPGFLVGGPNPTYKPDSCCPAGCGARSAAKCTAVSLRPPMDQPAQKSFKDFNAGWPLNSWEVTENSNAYQTAYIRLLSKFVK
ncbi:MULTISPECIES: glycoside hydrolase family 9 protein [Rhodopseudomonas]|uniref:glycoside hydrolase family 9 protein n=1 Tax=Rhodopseudomonas TaxID=1073 RepID=UPI0009B9719F|nr:MULTISPECIES: glycoside hydrolase family 9 protein [Rhodopseudomonas]MDF3810557.1 glycoside hydrolase family 9 protein [Rhodopseudomonas sp. BAL398]WOK18385.1 glycoside hydrolase family 9 protein [Rhodopseudomonas sp. BAL398]